MRVKNGRIELQLFPGRTTICGLNLLEKTVSQA